MKDSIFRLFCNFKSAITFEAFLQGHNDRHILRWYEWDLFVLCRQTPF